MKKWYLPGVLLLGTSGFVVWGQANAAPPATVVPGVVVEDRSPAHSPAMDDLRTSLPRPTPTVGPVPGGGPGHSPSSSASHDAAEVETEVEIEHPREAEHVPMKLYTYPPEHAYPSAGGSDDGPSHDLYDDKGGLRDGNGSEGKGSRR